MSGDNEVLVPDRIVINEKNEAVIIDYKTGETNKNHILQVKRYADVLKEMNYEVTDQILVYIDDKITVVKT